MAYDSKLWDRWAKISTAVAKTEGQARLIARAETLEASYEAIILPKLIADHGANRFEFEVAPDSTEAKLEEGDVCVVGVVDWPGFPMETAQSLGVPIGTAQDYLPISRYIEVAIEQFDRAAAKIIIQLKDPWEGFTAAFKAVMDSGSVPIGSAPIYLMARMPPDGSKSVTDILSEIGDPSCSMPAAEAILAMGQSAKKKIPKSNGADSPIARVLWDAGTLAKTVTRDEKQASKIAEFARLANTHELNDSQVRAAMACAQYQLSIIWGPPGTGKTDTLVALLHAIIREGPPRKILVTGPNYRTVEELSSRLQANLEGDPTASADYFWLYSKSRTPKDISSSSLNVNAASVVMGSPEFANLAASLQDGTRTTIVSTTAHIVHSLTKAVGAKGLNVDEIFDLIVLDESSQIPVTLALHPLGALKTEAQIIVAGDHKQMPPIQELEPPKGAEHLVDSIQTYLIKRFGLAQLPLLVNYRSNADLVDYAKSLGYPQKLVAAAPKKDLWPLSSLASVVSQLPSGLPITTAYEALLAPERRVAALIAYSDEAGH